MNMARMTLNASVRDAAIAADDVRAEARIPAVIYGGERKDAQSLSVDRSEFIKLYRQVTPSTLLDINIDGTTVPALVGEMQFDPLTDEIIHIDLRQVDLKQPVKTLIHLAFTGESPAMKLGGMLMTNRDFVKVQALPEKLVSEIEIDLAQLDSFEAAIQVKNVALPEGVALDDDENASVAFVKAPKTKEQIAAEEAAEAAEDAANAEAAAEADGEEKKEESDAPAEAPAEEKKEEAAE